MGEDEKTSASNAESNGAAAPDASTAEAAVGSESVRIMHGVLGLFTTPGIGIETEQEVKTRRELNEVVHQMLILGLVFSTVVLFVGLSLSTIFHTPLPTKVTGFHQLFEGLKKGSPPSVLSLGILLLISTPVLRVLGSLAEFMLKRDWLYTVVTSSVLLILALSLIAAKG